MSVGHCEFSCSVDLFQQTHHTEQTRNASLFLRANYNIERLSQEDRGNLTHIPTVTKAKADGDLRCGYVDKLPPKS